MKWFSKKTQNASTSASQMGSAQAFGMHWLALNPRNGDGPHAVRVMDSALFLLPSVTSGGRISFLLAGYEEDYMKMREDVGNRVRKMPKETKCYVCVAVNLMEGSPENSLLIYEIIGAPRIVPEVEDIYTRLTNLRTVGDAYWVETERHFQSEPAKSWITQFIEIQKQQLDWTNYVQSAIRRIKSGQ